VLGELVATENGRLHVSPTWNVAFDHTHQSCSTGHLKNPETFQTLWFRMKQNAYILLFFKPEKNLKPIYV
jgi:hypothetical protein